MVMDKLSILIISSEAAPYAKTGGLADVAGSLPISLKALGHDVRVILPYYHETKKNFPGLKPILEGIPVKIGKLNTAFTLYHDNRQGVDFYFIDKKAYYDRKCLYGTPSGDYPDNAVRFAFFCKAVLSSARALDFKPDIIHSNDWQSALVPFYLKIELKDDPFFRRAKSVFTIHNLAYQGVFPKRISHIVDIPNGFLTNEKLEFYGKLSYMKAGILYADIITTVSKGYAKEILSEKFGCGLHHLLNLRKADLYGILNGVDYERWDPRNDKFIKVNYFSDSIANKATCKLDLLEHVKFKGNPNLPLLGVITRLAWQKGVDILTDCIDKLVELNLNIVILGTGDKIYQNKLIRAARKYRSNLIVTIDFDNVLAHKIEAGSDIFVMPSRYEPCGLNQMYSLRYGTIPVVSAVGGLDDTIIDYDKDTEKGNGFKFHGAASKDLIGTVKRAIDIYNKEDEWNLLMKRCMELDFSWERSANEYIKIYKTLRQ